MASAAPRTPLIAGNWKMFPTAAESIRLVESLKPRIRDIAGVEVLLLPPYPSLVPVRDAIGDAPIRLGGQDLHWESEGAFTGAVSGRMLLDAGCTFVLVGHSERRKYFGDTDAVVNRKLRAALDCGLRTILAVGESETERTEGRTRAVVEGRLRAGLEGVGPDAASRLQVAYEPIWAIGTGRTATPEQAAEVHEWIRRDLDRLFPGAAGESVRILYGGSVTPENIDALMACPAIDGALVGGASLKPEGFSRIVGFRPA